MRDYDEAKNFYVQSLGFREVEDILQENGKRWVLLAPPGNSEVSILLQKALTSEQLIRVGNQTGGRVFLFLQTDDFDRDYETYERRGVKFIESPRDETYGKVVKFEDLYGNRWDLLQLTEAFRTKGSNNRV